MIKGQPLLTGEAMKIEQALNAPFAGLGAELRGRTGDQVTEGHALASQDKAD